MKTYWFEDRDMWKDDHTKYAKEYVLASEAESEITSAKAKIAELMGDINSLNSQLTSAIEHERVLVESLKTARSFLLEIDSPHSFFEIAKPDIKFTIDEIDAALAAKEG